MIEPTAEEALEWLRENGGVLGECNPGDWRIAQCASRAGHFGSTPLEAIRNAMKGESDD